ncbi:MAG: hypothetical protein GY845_23670 [Planctomycetes bacterium]|nr:hypothetical protein [Planctomycetota bacterium]
MISFFLPDSKDLVDPNYNFATDSYHHKRVNGHGHDVYAHEIYETPNFDGLLVTKSNINKETERQIIELGGMHNYFRLPKKYPVMGDCGAFQYSKEKLPPYTCQDICEYYDILGFDYGITLDHIIFDFSLEYDKGNSLIPLEPTEDMKSRYKITLDNAKEILNLVKDKKYKFKPIGCVQGWSPKSYHQAVKELIKVGFDYIAIGGVAKAPNKVIIPVLNEIRDTVLNANIKLHVLGVARFNILNEYKKTNVVSCDSASTIMQAFKSNKDNYHTPDNNYTAVRIPPVYGDASPKVRKVLKPFKDAGDTEGYKKRQDQLGKLEQRALKAVRAYAEKRFSLTKAMKALTQYEDEFGDEKKYYPFFEKTLQDRPWEDCPCLICKKLGVEVVIMRGNNRNRRRGFHNTWWFFKLFKTVQGTQ